MNRLLVLLIAVVLSTGCVETTLPEGCDEAAVTLDLQLSADALTPNNPAVCRGQEVTLVVQASADGVVHIHGYDEEVPATEVSRDERVELEFTAQRSGQFPIEFHPGDDPQGVSVGVLTVHET